jgi:hypothetical protein
MMGLQDLEPRLTRTAGHPQASRYRLVLTKRRSWSDPYNTCLAHLGRNNAARGRRAGKFAHAATGGEHVSRRSLHGVRHLQRAR